MSGPMKDNRTKPGLEKISSILTGTPAGQSLFDSFNISKAKKKKIKKPMGSILGSLIGGSTIGN